MSIFQGRASIAIIVMTSAVLVALLLWVLFIWWMASLAGFTS